ncbi:MAG: DUF4783 domain-containing protein [Cytophagales bacterium]|nr:DUF4783 domain-containing protein [Cytophagales bacterium]
MKRFVILCLCSLIIGGTTFATSSPEPKSNYLTAISSRIELSFKKGDSDKLVSLLDDEIELIIDSEDVQFNKISKEHAGFILATFFKKNTPNSFSYVYEGNSSEGLQYSVAKYQSPLKEFMVYVLIKKTKNNLYAIDTLQIREN